MRAGSQPAGKTNSRHLWWQHTLRRDPPLVLGPHDGHLPTDGSCSCTSARIAIRAGTGVVGGKEGAAGAQGKDIVVDRDDRGTKTVREQLQFDEEVRVFVSQCAGGCKIPDKIPGPRDYSLWGASGGATSMCVAAVTRLLGVHRW